jgi:hypothetical protein
LVRYVERFVKDSEAPAFVLYGSTLLSACFISFFEYAERGVEDTTGIFGYFKSGVKQPERVAEGSTGEFECFNGGVKQPERDVEAQQANLNTLKLE